MCARERYIEPALLDKMIESLRTACDANDARGDAAPAFDNLVPEYRAAEEVNAEAVGVARRASQAAPVSRACVAAGGASLNP